MIDRPGTAGIFSWLAIWIISSIFLALILTFFAPATVQAATPPPEISATSAILIDTASGRILYSKNMHRRQPMASTTKITTALTALSIEGTNLAEKYTVVREDQVGEATMGLRVGEVVTFEDLLYGMLLNSGNDAATAIARYAGAKLPGSADPVTRFVTRMNQTAQSFGMRDSSYANPHGLDQADHYSSAFDLAIAGWYALKNPTLSQIIQTKSATRAGHPLSNLNKLLQRYPGATGIKPGLTDNAGYCLVASATRNGQSLISIILGDNAQGYQTDADRLLTYGFDQLAQPDLQKVIQQGSSSANATDYLGRPSGDRLITFAQTGVPGEATGANIVNLPANGALVLAGINQSGASQGQVTPSQINGSSSSSTSQDSTGSESQPKGGINFFSILILLIVATAVFYLILRFTPVGGDSGRNIAYQMETIAGSSWRVAKSGAQRLWGFVRPAAHEEPAARPGSVRSEVRPSRSKPTTAQTQTRPFSRQDAPPSPLTNNPNRVSWPQGRATRIETEPEETITPFETPPVITPNRQNPSRPVAGYTPAVRPKLEVDNNGASYSSFAEANSTPTDGTYSPVASGLRGPNPLENFFDGVDPFGMDETESHEFEKSLGNLPPAPKIEPPAPQPPMPLSSQTPLPGYPKRTAAEPQQKPDDPHTGYRTSRPAMPNPLPPLDSGRGQPTPPRPNSEPGGYYPPPGENNSARSGLSSRASSEGTGENIVARARQAIDYAYANRYGASTEEFRRVIEQDPMFDFGTIEEFDQLPMLGFKALATAYRDAGRGKVAILLLDMAIDRYPNNLELRSMQRTLRRDLGQE